MDEEEIEWLKTMLARGDRLAWRYGSEYREIVEIGLRKEPHEGPEGLEDAGIFLNGEYVALMACSPDEIVQFEVTGITYPGDVLDLSEPEATQRPHRGLKTVTRQ